MATSVQPVIALDQVTKQFGDLVAVNEASLRVYPGDVYGVLGPNGAGKTTTMSMILSLVAPTAGNITVLGETVTTANNSVLRRVGALLGDQPAYFPYLTGRQNVAYMARLLGASPSRINEVLQAMGLHTAADRSPANYSTGMKQRLGLAMALVHEPEILILDEPTNGLDPTGRREIRDLITQLADRGLTIILCSHILAEVEQVCNRVAIFNRGKIVAEDTLAQLQPASSIVCVKTSVGPATKQFLQKRSGLTIKQVASDHLEIQGWSSQELLTSLVQHDLAPQEVYLKENSLEEIFLSLVDL